MSSPVNTREALIMNKQDPNIGRQVRGILFDFDGTLTSPGSIDFMAIKRAIHCPAELPILEFLDTLPPARRAPLQKILEKMEEEAALKSTPNDGAEACLLTLKEMGIPLGILTRNSLKSVHLSLERFNGIDVEDFTVIITRDDSLPKPHPDGARQAARRMGISVTGLLVVGDFRFDILCGKAAGASTVLLASGMKSVMLPDDPEPDYVVNRLEEILDILR